MDKAMKALPAATRLARINISTADLDRRIIALADTIEILVSGQESPVNPMDDPEWISIVDAVHALPDRLNSQNNKLDELNDRLRELFLT